MAKVLYAYERTKKILKLLVSIAQREKLLGLCFFCFMSVFHLCRMQNTLFSVVDQTLTEPGFALLALGWDRFSYSAGILWSVPAIHSLYGILEYSPHYTYFYCSQK